MQLKQHFQVTEFRFLQVEYMSQVTWESTADLLRCNPRFHGQPRYDHIIFNDKDGHAFARLIYLFICEAGGLKIPMALIQDTEKGVGGRRRIVDRDLGFHRVRMAPRNRSRFIPLRSVVRGALLVQDSQTPTEYVVVDTIDTDMFLRMRGMFPHYYQ